MAVLPPQSASREVEQFSNECVAELIHQKLLSQLPLEERTIEDPQLPTECLVTRWRSDPYSRGSYSFMKTKAYLKFNEHGEDDHEDSNPLDMIEMSKPLWDGALGFAGEHCAVDHYGKYFYSSPPETYRAVQLILTFLSQ